MYSNADDLLDAVGAEPRRLRTRTMVALGCVASVLAFGACTDSTEDPAPSAPPWSSDGGTNVFEAGAVLPDGGFSLDAATSVDSAIPSVDGAVSGADSAIPGADATSGAPPAGDLCHLDGNQVGIVGDSYIHWTEFTEFLEDSARKAGALKADEHYIDHAFGGASMNGFPSIPDQWPEVVADAKAQNSKGLRLTIMTGGGNDMLVNNRDCLEFVTAAEITQDCKTVVQEAIDTAKALFNQMKNDGVKEMIFFFYPHLPEDSLGGGTYPNTILDYALPLVKQNCETQSAIPCHFIDMRPFFDDGRGFPKEGTIELDGIHPTDVGARLLADNVWKVMQERCLASK
jgi:lysophospholipase L1-like esterase